MSEQKGGAGGHLFAAHPLRDRVLNEIHARPFHVVRAPRVVVHYAFMTGLAAAEAAEAALVERCRQLGVRAPRKGDRHHIVEIGEARLRFEVHTEFTTYSIDAARPEDGSLPDACFDFFHRGFTPPGPMMVAARLDLVADNRPVETVLERYDTGSLAVSAFRDQRALGITDFRADAEGLTRFTVIDRGLLPYEIGPMVQRIIEVETYRTLALLGLPEAQRLQPAIAAVESGLLAVTGRIAESVGITANRALLDELTAIAGRLEAESAATAYRFGATRAYSEIVRLRLASLREAPVPEHSRWSSFLNRRMAPALSTCATAERRMADLSDRLSRTANLLRTRIEVELEQQNRELLSSMNTRARMQLRLQQTVEGLSVAAVSYYVVGLIGYIAKGAGEMMHLPDPGIVTGFAVLPVALIIWLMVRRIRAAHGPGAVDDGRDAGRKD